MFTPKTVAIIGSGTMGAGIASWFSTRGVRAYLCDLDINIALEAIKGVHTSWDRLVQKGKYTKEEVSHFKDLLEAREVSHIDENVSLVIEAIVENLDIKSKLFKSLDEKLSKDTVFATNTSSLSVSALSLSVGQERKSRFIGLHFFNPAPVMKLVEIIPIDETGADLPGALAAWFSANEKMPAICKDRPGFIVNRLARNFYGEAMRIAPKGDDEGLFEVDSTLTSVGGFKMGPFELMDLIGVDVNFAVSESVWKANFREPRFAPHPLQSFLVSAGRHGRKSKRGFYRYE